MKKNVVVLRLLEWVCITEGGPHAMAQHPLQWVGPFVVMGHEEQSHSLVMLGYPTVTNITFKIVFHVVYIALGEKKKRKRNEAGINENNGTSKIIV